MKYTLEQIANIGAAAFFIVIGFFIVFLMAGGIALTYSITKFADLLSNEADNEKSR